MYINTKTGEYPYDVGRVLKDNPQTSFREKITEENYEACGVFKVVETLPPFVDDDLQYVLEGNPEIDSVTGKWTQVWVVHDYTPEEIQERIDSLRANLLEQATRKRWEVETDGVVLQGGIEVATGTDDQNRITTVISNARRAGLTSVEFKAVSGWLTLPIESVEAVADGITYHVQACFAGERAHHEAISSLATMAALRSYDVSIGWPPRDKTQPVE